MCYLKGVCIMSICKCTSMEEENEIMQVRQQHIDQTSKLGDVEQEEEDVNHYLNPRLKPILLKPPNGATSEAISVLSPKKSTKPHKFRQLILVFCTRSVFDQKITI